MKNTPGVLVMALSCTALAWQCSPRVEIAEGDVEAGGAGESSEASSGRSFGGGPPGAQAGAGGEPGEAGGRASSAGSGGSGAVPDPGSAGQPSAGGAGDESVCTPGVHQTCNDDPAASALWGSCESDGTCTCTAGFVINPATGKCAPSSAPVACALPKDPGDCFDVGVPHFYFDVSTGRCEEFLVHCGGTPRNANAFETLADCEAACAWTNESAPAVAIRGRSCVGFGRLVTGPGDESSFELEGTVLKRTMQWGCGCPKRPEFVMMTSYGAGTPVELRLCHDELADSCEALCTEELSWDLGEAFEAAGTTEFVFVE